MRRQWPTASCHGCTTQQQPIITLRPDPVRLGTHRARDVIPLTAPLLSCCALWYTLNQTFVRPDADGSPHA